MGRRRQGRGRGLGWKEPGGLDRKQPNGPIVLTAGLGCNSKQTGPLWDAVDQIRLQIFFLFRPDFSANLVE
jgi:hypothetical protein